MKYKKNMKHNLLIIRNRKQHFCMTYFYPHKVLLLSLFFVLLICAQSKAQCPPPSTAGTYTVVYTSNCSFTVPASVSSIQFECWGGGGGGGGAKQGGLAQSAGGGGGGGAYSVAAVAVNSGDNISINVGS